MPQLIPVLAYLGTYYVAEAGAGWALAAYFASAVVVGDYERRQQASKARDAYNASLRDRMATVRTSAGARSIAYGQTMSGGVVAFARSWGTNDEKLSVVVALNPGHELTSIDEIYFFENALGALDQAGNVTSGKYFKSTNDAQQTDAFVSTQSANQVVTLSISAFAGSVTAQYQYSEDGRIASSPLTVVAASGTSATIDTSGLAAGQQFFVVYNYTSGVSLAQVRKYLGTFAQVADATLVANTEGEWTANHRGRGQPYVAIDLTFDPDIFSSGIPDMRFLVHGKKLYDPRSGLTVYSENPALCVRDYLMSPLGFGCSAGEIDDVLISAAANACDELVPIDGQGGTQKRYTVNGLLSTEAGRIDNLRMLCESMAGFAVWSQGKWRVYAGVYRSPTYDLTDADFTDREAISIVARKPRADLFNAVRGTYLDPKKEYQETDFPPVTNAFYESEDGAERIYLDITLPLVNDALACQRIGKVALEASRQALSVTASFGMRAYRLVPGDNVRLTAARYGFASKVFRVTERRFSLENGVILSLVEEAAGVYDWNYGEATTVDLAPNSTLPSPWFVAPLSNLQIIGDPQYYQTLADGTIIPRALVTWDMPTDIAILQGGWIELQFRSVDIEFQSLPNVPGNINSALEGPAVEGVLYQVRARARNSLGVASAWTYSAWVKLGSQVGAPPDVTTFTVTEVGATMRRYAWTMSSVPFDLAGFEGRYKIGSSFDWATATLLGTVPASASDVPSWFAETNQPEAAGTYSFGIKAYDTLGNYSANAKTVLGVALSAAGTADATPPAGSYFIDVVSALPGSGNWIGRIVFLTTDEKLYRWTAGGWTAAVPAVDVSGQLSDAQIADIAAAKLTGQITSTQITNHAITTAKLSAGAVTTAKLAAGAVTADEIAANTITAEKIVGGTITSNELATDSVTSDQIVANSIITGKILVGVVSANVTSSIAYTFATVSARSSQSWNITGPFITLTGGWVRVSLLGTLWVAVQVDAGGAAMLVEATIYPTVGGAAYGQYEVHSIVTTGGAKIIGIPLAIATMESRSAGSHQRGLSVTVLCTDGNAVTKANIIGYGHTVHQWTAQEIKV